MLAEQHLARPQRAEVGDRLEPAPASLHEAERQPVPRPDDDHAGSKLGGDPMIEIVGSPVEAMNHIGSPGLAPCIWAGVRARKLNDGVDW